MITRQIQRTRWDSEETKFLAVTERAAYDCSLCDVLRAVLYPRIGDGAAMHVWEYSDAFGRALPMLTTTNDAARVFEINFDQSNAFYYLNLCKDESDVTEFFNKLDAACKEYPANGWEKVEMITPYMAKVCQTACYVNNNEKTTVVFCRDAGYGGYHFIQSGILAMIPYYFRKEDGISDAERRVFEALRGSSASEYVAAMNALFDATDLHNRIIESRLRQFDANKYESQIKYHEREIDAVRRNIADYESSVAEMYQKERVLIVQLRALREEQAANATDELLEYFKRCKSIKITNAADDGISYAVFGYLSYWDEDEADHNIRNDNSYIFSAPHTRYVSKNDMRSLMRAIFVDTMLRIRIVALYKLEASIIRGIAGEDTPAEFADRMQNPHIYYYHCLGNYENQISKAIKECNYVSAVEQTIASASCLNFGDSAVMCKFMEDMYTATKPFIELPDGKVVNPAEAVTYLKETGYITVKQTEEQTEDDTALAAV